MPVKLLPFFLCACAVAMATPLARASEALPGSGSASPVVPVVEVEARLAMAGTKGGRLKAVALLFFGRDCPISNATIPEMNRIIEKYEPLGVAFYFVYPESDLSDADAAVHAKEFGLRSQVAVDRELTLVKKAGVRVTPEAAVFGAGMRVIYRGRINDLYAGLGQRREIAQTHDLRDALDAVVEGNLPHVAFVQPVGCFIPAKP